jgi:hypothetical protein
MAAVHKSIADDREVSHKLYGRDIPYVLLMHVSAMSAHMMPEVLNAYRDAGYRFVSLAQAEADPAYSGYTKLDGPPPLSNAELAKPRHVILPAPPDYSAQLSTICS